MAWNYWACDPVLVVGEMGAQPWLGEPRTGIESDGAVCAGRIRGGSGVGSLRSLRGARSPPTFALPCPVLHGVGGGRGRIAWTIHIASPGMALDRSFCAAEFRNVFCAATTVHCQRAC